jgi:hypothetical protein
MEVWTLQATGTIEERHECMTCLEEAVNVYRDIVLVESQVRCQVQ